MNGRSNGSSSTDSPNGSPTNRMIRALLTGGFVCCFIFMLFCFFRTSPIQKNYNLCETLSVTPVSVTPDRIDDPKWEHRPISEFRALGDVAEDPQGGTEEAQGEDQLYRAIRLPCRLGTESNPFGNNLPNDSSVRKSCFQMVDEKIQDTRRRIRYSEASIGMLSDTIGASDESANGSTNGSVNDQQPVSDQPVTDWSDAVNMIRYIEPFAEPFAESFAEPLVEPFAEPKPKSKPKSSDQVSLANLIKAAPLALLRNLNAISNGDWSGLSASNSKQASIDTFVPDPIAEPPEASLGDQQTNETSDQPTNETIDRSVDVDEYLKRFVSKYERTYESNLLNGGLLPSFDVKQTINQRFSFRLPETSPIPDMERFTDFITYDSPNCKLNSNDCIRTI